MFAALLNKLFDSRNPDELMRERMGAWQDWLRPLAGADGDPGCGVGRDPGYEDAFFALKDEVGKLSAIDDALIIRCCEQLLKEVGKDARLATYYTFARLRQDGSAGFADGIELTAALVERFGENLLPVRSEARKGALEWLANARLLDQLARHQQFAPADLERAMAGLNLLLTRTAQWDVAARPNLQALLARFEPNEAASSMSAPAAAVVPDASTAPPSAQPASAVASQRDLLEQARVMAQYLRHQELGYLASARLIRCVRWDTVHDLPPGDQQARTRLAAPRPELRPQLKRLLLQKQWHELLERIEGAFMEGANHLWFDLQCWQHMALEQAGTPYSGWSELLRADFALMLERLGGIERQAFSDATPFADDATLDWIARHAVVRDLEAGEALAPASLSGDGSAGDAGHWREMEAQARDVLAGDGLEAAYAWLAGLPGAQSERHRFLQRRLMARLADHAGRQDTALHLLTELDGQASGLHLARWEPALAFDVKHDLLRALRHGANRKDADKPSLASRIGRLQAELTVLDPGRALGVM